MAAKVIIAEHKDFSQTIEIDGRVYTIKTQLIEKTSDDDSKVINYNVTIKRGSEVYTTVIEQKNIKHLETAINKEYGMTYVTTKYEDKIIMKLHHPLFPLEGQFEFAKNMASAGDEQSVTIKRLVSHMEMTEGIPIYPEMLGPCCVIDVKEPTIDVKTAKDYFDRYVESRNFNMSATPTYTPTAGDREQNQLYSTMFGKIMSEYIASYIYQKTEPIVSANQFCLKYFRTNTRSANYFGYSITKIKDLWTIYTPRSDIIKRGEPIGKIYFRKEGSDELNIKMYYSTIKKKCDLVRNMRKLENETMVCPELEWFDSYYDIMLPFDVEDGYYAYYHWHQSPNQPATTLIRGNKIYMNLPEECDSGIIVQQSTTLTTDFYVRNVKLAE